MKIIKFLESLLSRRIMFWAVQKLLFVFVFWTLTDQMYMVIMYALNSIYDLVILQEINFEKVQTNIAIGKSV